MKAVVLVGGEGTRMRPLTETLPKPLLPMVDRPFLDHVLDRLAAHGVDGVVLSSPYLEEVFDPFLQTRAGRPPSIQWITEAQPLGTAGAIANALDHLDDTFLVLNGDILTDLDLTALMVFHRSRGAVATISLAPVEDARPYGLVDIDPNARVRAFREKPSDPVRGTVNTGTYVLEPVALRGVSTSRAVSIETEVFPGLIDSKVPVYGFLSDAYWRISGRPRNTCWRRSTPWKAASADSPTTPRSAARAWTSPTTPRSGRGWSWAGARSSATTQTCGTRCCSRASGSRSGPAWSARSWATRSTWVPTQMSSARSWPRGPSCPRVAPPATRRSPRSPFWRPDGPSSLPASWRVLACPPGRPNGTFRP